MAGYQLRRIQQGLDPLDWKPMRTVGPGVAEIRIHTQVEHRVFYVARFSEGVYVLHAFEKRTRKTRIQDIELARARLGQVMGKRKPTKVTRSGGNVFRDLGFDPEEAEHLKVRSTLMIHLHRLIESHGLTQAKAASLFGVTQPRVSDLVRGKIALFSIDTLVDMLAHAGVHVRVEPEPSRGTRRVA